MTIAATLKTDSGDPESVAKSLTADNKAEGALSVDTLVEGGQVSTRITCDSLPTLLATIDDLLRCQMASEEVIADG